MAVKKSSKKPVAKAAKSDTKQIKDMAKKEYGLLKKKLAEAEKKTKEYINKNPKKAALIAAGVGAAIGAALTALLKRSKK